MKHAQGVWVPIHGKLVFPIYHPGYILRANDVTQLRKWEAEIYRFSETLKFHGVWDTPNVDVDKPPWCLYCGKECYYGTQVCYKHRNDWRNDQVWDHARRKKRKVHPDQTTMF
jgi:hypothetical protein